MSSQIVSTCDACKTEKRSPVNHYTERPHEGSWLPEKWEWFHLDLHDTAGEVVSGKSVALCPDCTSKVNKEVQRLVAGMVAA
jgi:hypothetical protein